MDFRTIVQVPKAPFEIEPGERMLFVGSCFADRMGSRFADSCFPVTANPYGVMYNPVSICHTVERLQRGHGQAFSTAVFTLGTNRVYVERSTGEIVDNCQKRPQCLFEERQLTVGDCADYLRHAVSLLRNSNPHIRIILTVSPIRYAKYGYHGSQLSKAVLLLAADVLVREAAACPSEPLVYFPAYELLNDELRDYRFYAPDMLHPSEQAVGYIWERFVDSFFSPAAREFLREWEPLQAALGHRPFRPESDEYRRFLAQTQLRLTALREKYPGQLVPDIKK